MFTGNHAQFVPSVLALGLLSVLTASVNAQESSAQVRGGMDEVVVTASRSAQRIGNLASSVEVISSQDFEQISGPYLTDVLKKGASVDVIQYPGGLSGIGIRGFRPEFSGTNKRVLILIDGHPAGFTSVGTAMRAGVGRVEVLKGSASALYGSSAMGGVVNFISHQSEGDINGQVALGAGSFGVFNGDARVGGSLTDRLHFDLSYAERSQGDDYRMGKQSEVFGNFVQGNGARRQNTTFEHRSAFARVAYDLSEDWRIQSRIHTYYSNDAFTPGAESDGVGNVGLKDIKGHVVDLGLTGTIGSHSLYALAYSSREADVGLDVDAGSFRDLERLTRYDGFQFQDTWQLAEGFTLLAGMDYEDIFNSSKRFGADGMMLRPFSPFDSRKTWGAFAELTGNFMDDRLILNAGLRFDRITAAVLQTPLRPDLTLGESTVDTTNPRIGAVFYPVEGGPIRLHASAGTGFVTPLANQLAGLFDETVGAQRRLTLGNPDLQPEDSDSYDIGFGYEGEVLGADLTWFRIDNKNKIESVMRTNTATLRETVYVNASSARSEGWELTLQGDLGQLLGGQAGRWLLDSTSTYFTERSQALPAGVSPLRNVARLRFNAGLGFHQGPAVIKLSGRHVAGMIDQDFSGQRIFTNGAGGLFEYPDFTAWDLFASWDFNEQTQLALQVDNLEDRYYYEKNDYPMPGRAYTLTLRHSF